MIRIGPVAARSGKEIHWFQIIIGDNGVCAEIKQASETEMIAHNWKTLDRSQWPFTISAYDPSVSQSHYILTRSVENQISKHIITKVNIPNRPISYNITNQTYLGTHIGPLTLLRNLQQDAELVIASWYPTSEEQTRLRKQYSDWEQSQKTIWHSEKNQPELDMSVQPLDFKRTDRGILKPEINNTGLSPHQQWIVQSIIADRLSELKNESSSSVEYAAALHLVIDGTQSAIPFSEATEANIEAVKKIISAAGINRYMSPNFYAKLYTAPDGQKRLGPLSETDPGYSTSIQSVIFYIQQLLHAEILQFFPDHPLNIAEEAPVTLMSSFKLGQLPVDHTDAINESASGLSRTEIRQIDDVYRLLTGTYALINADEQSLAELSTVIDSMQKRFAITTTVASTLRLLIPGPDSQYEASLKSALEQIEKHRQIKKILANFLTPDNVYFSSLQDTQFLRNDLSLLAQYLQLYTQEKQYAVLIDLLQKQILSHYDIIGLIDILCKKNPSIREDLATYLFGFNQSPENESFKLYYSTLANDTPIALDTPVEIVKNLSDIVDLYGPRTAQDTQFLEWISILLSPLGVWPKVKHSDVLRKKIDEYNLSNALENIFSTPYSPQRMQELIAVIPEFTVNNLATLTKVFRSQSEDRQIMIIRALLGCCGTLKLEDDEQRALKFHDIVDVVKNTFSANAVSAALAEEIVNLSEVKKSYFSLLENILSGTMQVDSFSYEMLLELETALNATFAAENESNQILNLLKMSAKPLENIEILVHLYKTIQGRLLAKKLSEYFDKPYSERSPQRLNRLLPNFEDLETDYYSNAQVLNSALELLSPAQQTQITLHIFNHQSNLDHVVRYFFGDDSTLKFTALLDVMKSLNAEQWHLLLNSSTILYVLRNLFTKYKQEFSKDAVVFLSDLSEIMLDKLMPQISDTDIQKYSNNYLSGRLDLKKIPQANTTDWGQTAKIISELFKRIAKSSFVEELAMAPSPKALKVMLLREIPVGYYYSAEYLVAIAMKRLSEHQAAIVLKQDLQLKSAGELGKKLALEIECLKQHNNGTIKLQRVNDALSRLSEDISPAEMYAELRNKNSPLAQAIYSPCAPTQYGFTLFHSKKIPDPDFVFLKEIHTCLDGMNEMFHSNSVSNKTQKTQTMKAHLQEVKKFPEAEVRARSSKPFKSGL